MMINKQGEKHKPPSLSVRGIRRSCNRELYRAAKRLKTYIPPEKMAEAEKLYLDKVLGSLPYIMENGNNHKLLADWWDDNVNADVAALWDVEPARLARAFRDAFGG
ncbi:dehydrogenase [Paenibacillus chartarius]|uniref:Dehydrogenase n=1 Tax=Paenibacillus chartarius TaxID=747481 RepID=A0ABV6DI58_9BACL